MTELSYYLKNLRLIIKLGDLLEESSEALVCPANSFGYMRGGLAQAIRIAGGDSIEEDARKKAPINLGDAVLTSAGKLKAKFIIHSPTMSLPMSFTTKDNVRKAVKAALNCALNHGVSSIAMPAMGTGTGWLPYQDAADVEIDQIIAFDKNPGKTKLIVIVAHSPDFFSALYKKAIKSSL